MPRADNHKSANRAAGEAAKALLDDAVLKADASVPRTDILDANARRAKAEGWGQTPGSRENE